MTDNVIPFKPELVGDGVGISPDDVLSAAVGEVVTVAIVGLDESGALYVAGSDGAPISYFLLARGQSFLLDHEVLRT